MPYKLDLLPTSIRRYFERDLLNDVVVLPWTRNEGGVNRPVSRPRLRRRSGAALATRSIAPLQKVRYAGALIVLHDGRLLLQARDSGNDVSAPGTLSTFGGRGEAGEEGTRDTLIREIVEELGIKISGEGVRYLTYIERFDDVKNHVVGATYYRLDLQSDPDQLKSNEGQMVVLTVDEALADPRTGPTTSELIHRYASTSTALHHDGSEQSERCLTVDESIAVIDIFLTYATYEGNV
jgi:8-oxo-dGTP pyrophosphatase MutT (NUDIX family)